MSSKREGSISFSSARMPPPSSWNTPNVSPRPRSSKVFLSSSGITVTLVPPLPGSTVASLTPRFSRMFVSAWSITPRLRRPRKSILTSPMFSQLG